LEDWKVGMMAQPDRAKDGRPPCFHSSFLPSFQQRSAFTLIELLVVIAVVAILAALLLPALQGAKFRASLAVCANNIRQCHIALQMYGDDNGGWYPLADEKRQLAGAACRVCRQGLRRVVAPARAALSAIPAHAAGGLLPVAGRVDEVRLAGGGLRPEQHVSDTTELRNDGSVRLRKMPVSHLEVLTPFDVRVRFKPCYVQADEWWVAR
jgi:prepilin-type N-terminal cleavage/methylation domain-containing protein